jgi:hypothetical protein
VVAIVQTISNKVICEYTTSETVRSHRCAIVGVAAEQPSRTSQCCCRVAHAIAQTRWLHVVHGGDQSISPSPEGGTGSTTGIAGG